MTAWIRAFLFGVSPNFDVDLLMPWINAMVYLIIGLAVTALILRFLWKKSKEKAEALKKAAAEAEKKLNRYEYLAPVSGEPTGYDFITEFFLCHTIPEIGIEWVGMLRSEGLMDVGFGLLRLQIEKAIRESPGYPLTHENKARFCVIMKDLTDHLMKDRSTANQTEWQAQLMSILNEYLTFIKHTEFRKGHLAMNMSDSYELFRDAAIRQKELFGSPAAPAETPALSPALETPVRLTEDILREVESHLDTTLSKIHGGGESLINEELEKNFITMLMDRTEGDERESANIILGKCHEILDYFASKVEPEEPLAPSPETWECECTQVNLACNKTCIACEKERVEATTLEALAPAPVPAPNDVIGKDFNHLNGKQRSTACKLGAPKSVWNGEAPVSESWAKLWAILFLELSAQDVEDIKTLGFTAENWGKPIAEAMVTMDDLEAILKAPPPAEVAVEAPMPPSQNLAVADTWQCSACETTNPGNVEKCTNCGH